MVDRRRLLALGTGIGIAPLLPGTAAAATGDLPRLRTGLAAGRSEFQAALYAALARRLPDLRSATSAAREQMTGSARRSASSLLARVHILASELDVKTADIEGAWVHAQAAVTAAEDCEDPAVLADATRICATPLRRQGRAGDAVLLLEDTLHRLDAEAPRAPSAIVAAAGSLALSAAYSAALAGQRTTALELVERAQEASTRLAAAARPRSVELSCEQVQLYQIGVHHLLGQDTTAARIARQIDPRALPTPERRARLGTDTARALLALGAHDQALAALLSIEVAAPEDAGRPSVRALTRELLTRRPAMPGLRDFAVRTHALST